MFKFEKSIFINRPLEEVFNFVTDLNNDVKWQSGIESVKQTSAEPTGVGSTWHYKLKALGRTVESDIQMTSYDPPKRVSVKAISGPVPFENTYTFKEENNGTHISIHGQAELGGFFKLAEGLVSKQLEKQLDTDINALKLLLEEMEVKVS